jgi:hypothetical protein
VRRGGLTAATRIARSSSDLTVDNSPVTHIDIRDKATIWRESPIGTGDHVHTTYLYELIQLQQHEAEQKAAQARLVASVPRRRRFRRGAGSTTPPGEVAREASDCARAAVSVAR